MTAGPPIAEAPGQDRSLFAIGFGIVALVIVAVIAVVLLGSREATSFSADTPEGVVQRHLAAVEDEDYEAAWGYLSADVQSDLSVEEYRRAARDYGSTASARGACCSIAARWTGIALASG
jgi:hypothetical protein